MQCDGNKQKLPEMSGSQIKTESWFYYSSKLGSSAPSAKSS